MPHKECFHAECRCSDFNNYLYNSNSTRNEADMNS